MQQVAPTLPFRIVLPSQNAAREHAEEPDAQREVGWLNDDDDDDDRRHGMDGCFHFTPPFPPPPPSCALFLQVAAMEVVDGGEEASQEKQRDIKMVGGLSCCVI